MLLIIIAGATKNQQVGGGEPIYPKRNNYARALSPYNHIYMEIDNNMVPENSVKDQGPPPPLPPLPVYEPLSETYMMSTLSDMSEGGGDYQLGGQAGVSSDVSRQSSHRENRPLITRNNFHQSYHAAQGNRNLLQTISGVLSSSQSVRLASNGAATLHHHQGRVVNRLVPGQVVQWPDGTRTLTRVQPTQFVCGQIQNPVHSQSVSAVVQMPMVSAAASVQPQFAHPVQANNSISTTTQPANV